MRQLILIRHGKAEVAIANKTDYNRGLTGRGLVQSAELGFSLSRQKFLPDMVLVSGAIRARQTWEALEPYFPKVKPVIDDRLYNASAGILQNIIDVISETLDKKASLMLIGHNPGMHDLVLLLARSLEITKSNRSKLADSFALNQGMPTATAAVFDIKASKLLAWFTH